jgi:tRNA-dihydrouridine synthase
MIGQAAIGNPRIFTPHQPSLEERLQTTLRHLDLAVACEQLPTFLSLDQLEQQIHTNLEHPDFETHAIVEFRKFLFQYVKGIPESREWKTEILTIKRYGTLRETIIRFFSEHLGEEHLG